MFFMLANKDILLKNNSAVYFPSFMFGREHLFNIHCYLFSLQNPPIFFFEKLIV